MEIMETLHWTENKKECRAGQKSTEKITITKHKSQLFYQKTKSIDFWD